ncbi:MAG: hypothetical protein FIB01_01035 [Gemmatimonadetes bacterium]|nr:hypothetical protein [Gemmatimonadota bacterium]
MGTTGEPAERGGFRWELVALLMGGLLLFMGYQVWRRIRDVDPLERCAAAYDHVHTAVDSGLVDRIDVRWPGPRDRTNCGALRAGGRLQTLPRRPGGGQLPPRPQP